MKDMPLLYRKLITYIKDKDMRVMDSNELETDLSNRFRITREEIRDVIRELKNFGVKYKKTQRRIEFE